MKFFSIITVCKNNFQELLLTFNSIISQSINDYEWIVVDGNSNDSTQDWLRQNNLPIWVSEPDNGIYDAMNKGIAIANGKYLIFMNSGDRFENETVLDECKKSIESYNMPAFVYGDSIDIAEDGLGYYRKAKSYKKNWKGMITQHQSMFFNRKTLGKQKYSEEYILSGDYAFISSFLKDKTEIDILYLDFAVCKFSMGGLNELKRFDAIKEDFIIRNKIISLPFLFNTFLYSLHFTHAIVKKAIPSLRFLKHKSAN